ncbi:MAG: hypothetical protein INQ03_00210 [Candidatus Heimdallarchaeota archaeon]|nr:hypothetical protein [Candidatus Heimdallarchaeota archaeon]
MTESKPPKLIFAGLDKAGKTTIYQHVLKEMNVSEIKDLRPTRGIERHAHDFLDQDFSVWDLGGQLSYRQTYLSKPEVFNQTSALIFVVDIQDFERIQEAYAYYVDILNILVNVENKPKLYVLFHKYDPELRGKLRNNFYKATRIFRKADTILNIKFKGYATSIFSNQIELAVKRILFDNFEQFSEEPTGTVKAQSTLQVDISKKSTDSGDVVTPPTSTPTPTTVAAPGTPEAKSSKPSISAPTPTTSAAPGTPEAKAPTPSISAPTPTTSAAPGKPEVKAPTPSISAPTPTTSAAPAPTTAAIKEPEVSEPEKTVEEIIEEEPESTSDEMETKALEEATPKSFDDISQDVVERLTNVINKRMKDTPEIVALSILSSKGEQVLGIGKSDDDYEKLEKLRAVVGQLNPERFFKDLTDIEYRGLGHFPMNDFDIFFARASDNYAVAVLVTDISTIMLQNAQRIVKSIRQGLSLTADDDALDDEDKPKTKKKDLVSDLRSRLRNLSGLEEV